MTFIARVGLSSPTFEYMENYGIIITVGRDPFLQWHHQPVAEASELTSTIFWNTVPGRIVLATERFHLAEGSTASAGTMTANETRTLIVIDLQCTDLYAGYPEIRNTHIMKLCETRHSTTKYHPSHKVVPRPKPRRYLFAEPSSAHQMCTFCWHQCSGQKRNKQLGD